MNSASIKNIAPGFVKTGSHQQAGLACLASVIQFYGDKVDLNVLLGQSGEAANGISLSGLMNAAQFQGFNANGFKANVDALKQVDKPVILHISKDAGNEDFIVMYGWQNNKFIIGDPNWGIVEYREEELDAVWTSKTLLFLEPGDGFLNAKNKARLKRKWFIKQIEKQKKVLLILGFLGFVAALLLIGDLHFIEKKTIELIALNEMRLLLKVWFVLFIPVLFVVVIFRLKKVFSQLGAKSFKTHLNTIVAQNVFSQENNENEKVGGKVNSLGKASSVLSEFVFACTFEGPFYFIFLIGSVIVLTFFSLWAGIIVILFGVFLALYISNNFRKIEQLYFIYFQSLSDKTEILKNNSNLFKHFQLTNSKKKFVSSTVLALELFQNSKDEIDEMKRRLKNWYFIGVVFSSILLISLVFYLPNQFSFNLLHFFIYALLTFWLLFKIYNLAFQFFSAKSALNSIYNSIDFNSESETSLSIEINTLHKISAENIAFAFPGMHPVFQEIDFSFELGKMNLVHGQTGSGKSVLFSALNRLLFLTQGEIKINDFDWWEINNFQLRNLTSTVLQPVNLFPGSVLRNIAWRKQTFKPEKMVAFCKKNEFHDFFIQLENGYKTDVNCLSAGQKQLVSFVAAIFRNPKLLLLDEPFSFMDEEMERVCVNCLQKLKDKMLVVVFTKSKELKAKADNICCL